MVTKADGYLPQVVADIRLTILVSFRYFTMPAKRLVHGNGARFCDRLSQKSPVSNLISFSHSL
jgi:hypothetical protein